MISAKLNGGLCNQMFQIATTYTLATDNGDKCAFNFNVPCVHQGRSPIMYRNNIYNKLIELPISWKPAFIYKEPSYGFSPIPYHPNMRLEGYFGHPKYFNHRKEDLMYLFKDHNIVRNTKKKYNNILNNSVSLHVRRGDYFKFADVYIFLTKDYYYNAIELLDKQTQIDNIIVLSDDIRWCQRNFHDDRMYFVQHEPDYIDLYIMSLSDHNILANSSFSWWGTYLNENKDKIVYAPSKWFKDEALANEDNVMCENWIKI